MFKNILVVGALALGLSACSMGNTISDEQALAYACTSGTVALQTIIIAHQAGKMSDAEYANLKEPVLKFQKVCGAPYPMSRAELEVVGFDKIVTLLKEKATK